MSATDPTSALPAASPDTAPVAETAAQAARPTVPAPEQALTPDAPAAATPNVSLLVPPEKPLPPVLNPMPAAVADVTAAPLGHANKALTIERNLAKFIRARITPALAQGLAVDVALANSNAVTGTAGHHDFAVTLTGNSLTDDQVHALLAQHPALAAAKHCASELVIMPSGPGQKFKYLALNDAQVSALLAPPPALQKHGTPVDAADAAPEAAVVSSAEQPAAAAAPEAIAAPLAEPQAAPASPAEQPVVATAPAQVQAVAPPVTQITNPALHHGPMAANDHAIAVGA